MKKVTSTILLLLFSLFIVGCEEDKDSFHFVNFETGDGQYIQREKVYEGELVKKPVNPQKKGYRFDDWYIDAKLENKFDFNVYEIYEDVTIYAKFLKEYIVSLNPNGGYLLTNEIVVLENEVFELPIPDALEGFYFIGWFSNDIRFESNIIFEDVSLLAKYGKFEGGEIDEYTIKLDANFGEVLNDEMIVGEDEYFQLPTPVVSDEYEFIGWYDEDDVLFDSNTTNRNLNLHAKYTTSSIGIIDYTYGSYNESIWFDIDGTYQIVDVYYNLINKESLVKLDNELIRNDETTTQIDIVGISKGLYNVKIILNNELKIEVENINVSEYDRSGYAHFNYTNGVGAYKDDGTLKEDAIVIYVNDENKDLIQIPGISETGLGWILNNNQYSNNNSTTYNPTKFNNSLAKFNRPITFRLIGKVTPPQGLTGYNSNVNGGSLKDNGFMARMKDANNITIEGVGEDAMVFGWGIHFMSSTANRGIGFELRNLTFDKYPEDAIGMEGVQDGNTLTNPVQRGFIHNNTFLQGYAENPAESDKWAGDGTLDIKRGKYFTISYNKFLSTQKTNLVGAGDKNLQYHITYHHNLWYNVQSRIPLARAANIHMYNNVFYTSDDQEGENSTAQDVRADAYIFSENNYFHATKNPTIVKKGAVKSFGDIKYSTYNTDDATYVDNRIEKVSSNNEYANFDTNPNIFYYDEVNEKSDVTLLTDAFQAKVDVFAMSGTNKREVIYKIEDHFILNQYPNVTVNEIKKDTNLVGGKILKGIPYFVFKIDQKATFTMSGANGKVPAILVDNYGVTMLLGDGSVTLDKGIYILESSISHGASKGKSQAKESFVQDYSIIFK